MEILSLKVVLTEEDVNGVIAKHLGTDTPVRDLRVRLTPAGVEVAGTYPVTLFKVKFETVWELSVRGRELAAHLANLNVAGAPAGLVRGTLMEMLGANLASEEGLRVEDETVFVDPDVLLGRLGLSGRTNLSAVRCEAGRLVVEGSAPLAG
jgi:hypothetical protein